MISPSCSLCLAASTLPVGSCVPMMLMLISSPFSSAYAYLSSPTSCLELIGPVAPFNLLSCREYWKLVSPLSLLLFIRVILFGIGVINLALDPTDVRPISG